MPGKTFIILTFMVLLPAAAPAAEVPVAVSTIPVVPVGKDPVAVVSTVPFPGAVPRPVPARIPPVSPSDLKQPELKIDVLYLDKAIEEVSRDTAAAAILYNAVKEVYLRQGKTEKAISLLATYEKNRGADLGLLGSLASLYEQAGALEKAMKVHERIVSLDSENLWANNKFMLAELYTRQGNADKAVSLAESLVRKEPDNPSFLRLLAGAQQAAKDWRAEETAKKVIRLAPQAGDYQRLSEIYLQQNKYDEALAALEDGARKLPAEEVPLGILKSDVYTRKGDTASAQRILNELLYKANSPTQKNNIKFIADNLRKSIPNMPLAAPSTGQAVAR